ncbi:MAG: sugar ABC transporter substrate-binding protein [Rhodococcus sp. (in: high G+C Gram-positive bacteria)]
MTKSAPLQRFSPYRGLILAGAVTLFAVTACSSNGGASTSPDAASLAPTDPLPPQSCTAAQCNVYDGVDLSVFEGKKVGILNVAPIPTPWRFTKNVQQCVESNGGEVDFVEVGEDTNKVPGVLQGWINSGYSAIFDQGVPLGNQVGLMTQAAQKNIPVVGYAIGDPAGFISIDADQKADGALAAEQMVTIVGESATVGIVGNVLNQAMEDRKVQAEAVFAKYPGIKVKYLETPDFNVRAGQDSAAALLSANPDMTGIIGGYDDYTQGAARAIQAAKSDAIVVGIDGSAAALDDMRNGLPIAAEIADPHESASRLACETVAEILNGKKPLGTQIFLESILLTSIDQLPATGQTDLSAREVTVIKP